VTETVLIVDDSLTVRMDLAEAFEAAGFSTSLAASAAEAQRVLAERDVGVVVLDVNLPDGDGVALLKFVRASSNSAAVVLMLSSAADVEDHVRALERGADEYVGKPYDRGYVVQRARELLEEQRARGQARTRVLVIDDSMTFREELRRALTAAGYDVIAAASGEEGLRMAAEQRPQAVVVDGVLPGIDGPTVIRRIRSMPGLHLAPCVLLTGSEQHSDELRAFDSGADALAGLFSRELRHDEIEQDGVKAAFGERPQSLLPG
jgi:DNA-binding response OmpR family regulator